jgi:acetyl esterase/lipase
LAGAIAAILAVIVVVTQALAVVPVGWLAWALDFQLSQAIILRLGNLRDGLGVWNVLIAAVGTILALLVLMTATGHRRWEKIIAVTSSLGLASAIATTAALIGAAAHLGVAAFPLLPTRPFAAVGGHPDQTVTFGRPEGSALLADLYLSASTGMPRPVVVSIHGGGFALGGRAPNAYTRFLADHGYVVMDIDYRLASKDLHTWRTEVADVGCALTWIKTHAGEYGMDPDRVATFGESAGGSLAINAAYMANSGTLEPACGTTADVPRVRAAIGGYPAVDLTRGTRATAIGRLVGLYYVGGSSEQYPDRYAQVDSATHINTNSPPTLIFQGSRDHLVLAEQVHDFAELLSARGVVNSYIEYPGLDHGCGDSDGVLTYGTAASRLLILQWLDAYLKSS